MAGLPIFYGPLIQVCGECGQQQAIVLCYECAHVLCYDCTAQIHRFKAFEGHRLFPLNNQIGHLSGLSAPSPLVPTKQCVDVSTKTSDRSAEVVVSAVKQQVIMKQEEPAIEEHKEVADRIPTRTLDQCNPSGASPRSSSFSTPRSSSFSSFEISVPKPTAAPAPPIVPKGDSTCDNESGRKTEKEKAPSSTRKITKKSHITKEALQDQFHLPLAQAAKNFGVCVTFMKRICREQGILRWPYRRLKSLQQRMGDKCTDGERDEYMRAIYQAVEVDEQRAPSPVCILGDRMDEDEDRLEDELQDAFLPKKEGVTVKQEGDSVKQEGDSVEDMFRSLTPKVDAVTNTDVTQPEQLLGDLCVFFDTEAGLTWLQSTEFTV